MSGEAPTAGRGQGELTRRASLNAVASAVDYIARLIVGFVVNPVLVAGLGSLAYGVWQVIGRLVGYISPASGRPTQTLKWTIANRQASADEEEKRRQVGSAIVVAGIFLPILLPLGLVVSWFAPAWLRSPDDLVWPIRSATFLLVVNLVVLNFVSIPRSVLEGENLGYKRMGLSALLVFVGGGLTIAAVKLGTGLPGVAAATLLATILTGLTFLFVVRAFVPWFAARWPSRDERRAFLSLSWWFLGWRLVMQLLRASDVVVLGVADSPELVTVYTLTRYVPETLITFVGMLVFGVAPGLGGLIGAGKLKKSAEVRAEMMAFTWLLATVSGVGILLWNRSFVGLWVGPEFYAGDVANLMIVLLSVQFVLLRNDANIIDLTLDLKSKVIVGGLAALLAIGLALAGVLLFDAGIVGLCVGFLAGRAVLGFLYPKMIGDTLDAPLAGQLRASVRPTLVAAALFAGALLLAPRVGAGSWAALVAVSLLTVLVVGPLGFYAGLSRDARRRLVERTARVVRTLRPGRSG